MKPDTSPPPQQRRGSGVPRIELDRATCTQFEAAIDREWLVTNGLGSYAAGTVAGPATRRYHGLLVAALRPPLGRALLIAGLDVYADYRDKRYGLSSQEYLDGTVHPSGFQHLEAFNLTGGMPWWFFAVGDARLTQSVWMARDANTTYVRFKLESASAPFHLRLSPLCTYRDYHTQRRGGWPITTVAVTDGIELDPHQGATRFRILCPRARFEPTDHWSWNFQRRWEAMRGLDSVEDLYCPGEFSVALSAGDEITLILTAEEGEPPRPAVALAADQRRRAGILLPFVREPGWLRQLALAADQFIVRREPNRPPSGELASEHGATVIAGYPWFGDWGRDTMIALPGLTLPTRRPAIAARILQTFATHLSEGMLPNRFPEDGEAPAYNTVDATLWFFHSLAAYFRATGDDDLLRGLWPRLIEIIDWHLAGTRHGIKVDPGDGLLAAGEPGVQLTWMDAKVGDWVVTPRLGKPVEINALWHYALLTMGIFGDALDDPTLARRYRALASRVRDSFRERFWYSEGAYLYDVVDGPNGDDTSLRPNQIFAVSLSDELLDELQSAAVVQTCQQHLLTPMGLRTLAPTDERYVGIYEGGPRQRDGAYHQGTVWSWLLGPFALAHFRVHGDATEARALLAGVGSHVGEAGVGTISEIFDGDAPHRPRGCIAQAWSVAEILRVWFELKG